MIPGANVLKMALSIIASQTITYHQASGRVLNSIGQDVTSYNAPVFITGSFQPVPKSYYIQYNLDFAKTYFTFYTSNNLIDLQRNVSEDQITFNSQRFQCESAVNWFNLDGWKGVLCCLIDTPDNSQVFGFNETPQVNENVNFNNGGFDA